MTLTRMSLKSQHNEATLRQQLAAFRQSHRGRSIFQLANSLVPYVGLW